MRNGITILAFLLIASQVVQAAASTDDLIEHGDFKGVAKELTAALNGKNLTPEERTKIEFQIDWLERVRQDYPFTKEDLFNKLSKSMRNLTQAEFDKWIADGWFDSRKIDGVEKFVGTSISNIYFRHPELVARRTDGKNNIPEQKGRLELARAITKAANEQHTPYVLPYHLKNTLTVTLDQSAAPAGETIRAWLPIPRVNPHQNEIKFLGSSSPIKELASENSPIRSAYMEQKSDGEHPNIFKVSYTYTSYGVHFDLNPLKIQPINLSDPELKKYTSEQPHVIFNDHIKKLAKEIAGKETNPMLKAKAYFDWIAANIKYSYAREYSTLTNLSEYTCSNGYGDCGQEGMLFITLCRSAGIPARWQTGWDLWPTGHDIHDWTEIYLAPYGWLPCDPWAAIFAKQYCTALTPQERLELRDFYFGGLDQWRMIANSDHTQPLVPAKKTFRSDDIDFQRGEFEWGTNNIYFNKYDSYKTTTEKLDLR